MFHGTSPPRKECPSTNESGKTAGSASASSSSIPLLRFLPMSRRRRMQRTAAHQHQIGTGIRAAKSVCVCCAGRCRRLPPLRRVWRRKRRKRKLWHHHTLRTVGRCTVGYWRKKGEEKHVPKEGREEDGPIIWNRFISLLPHPREVPPHCGKSCFRKKGPAAGLVGCWWDWDGSPFAHYWRR